MKSYQSKTDLILFLVIFLFIHGCDKTDSTETTIIQKSTPSIIGTWQQTTIGEEDVSGVGVKMIITERTLTMSAPDCSIIGDYSTAGNVLTFTITSVEGERCASNQKSGGGGSVKYTVTDSQLHWYPPGAGEKDKAVYIRLSKGKS